MHRVNEGVPRGRIVELYSPDMFRKHEEVIIFNRDEFNHTYTTLGGIDHINKANIHGIKARNGS